MSPCSDQVCSSCVCLVFIIRLTKISWINLVARARAQFYFLNYFSVREIMHLSELLVAAAAREDNADAEQAYVSAADDIYAHLRLVTSFVQPENAALFVTQWLQSQVCRLVWFLNARMFSNFPSLPVFEQRVLECSVWPSWYLFSLTSTF